MTPWTGILTEEGGWENISKTVSIICRHCRVAGTHSDTDYKRRMTGEGIIYRAIQRIRVKCPDCGEDLELVLLEVH